MATLGKHIILEMKGCCKDTINDVNAVRDILMRATEAMRATLVDVVCHRFSPYGVTGVAILAESHISVHTWPEYGYVAVDIFICGNTVDPESAASYVIQSFHAKKTSALELKRGDISSPVACNDEPTKINPNILIEKQ